MPQVSTTIEAKPRTPSKKGAARRLRAQGQVPASAYGPGLETTALTLDAKSFTHQRRHFGGSHVFDVAIEGGNTFKALVKNIQQNPVNDHLVHVDLYALDMTKPVAIQIPVILQGKPAGAIEGGLLQQVIRKTEIECLPSHIPTELTLDVSPMVVGDTLHLSDIKLPAEVRITAKHDEAVVSVVAPEAEPEPEAVAAEGAEGAAPVEGAEGAAPADAAAAADAKPDEEKKS